MSYDINVLVNGNRCKQYFHNGRVFVEAKEGSEYVIEIKNNSWEKVLAVVAVDGLNIIDGEAANEDGAGYVIDRYCSQKFYGYQYSKEKVATFKFGALGTVSIDPKTGEEVKLGYASSKGDGSEKNAGIIGVRIWDEVPQPEPIYSTFQRAQWTTGSTYGLTSSCALSASYSLGTPYPANSWKASTVNSAQITSNGLYGPGKFGYSVANASTINSTSNLLKEAIADAKAVRQTCLANTKGSPGVNASIQDNSATYCCSAGGIENVISELEQESDKASFDMETQWGESRTHKVKEIKFERKSIIHALDIFYASRESLVAMGVDLGTEKRVSFPESFRENRYAKPPKGWNA